MTAFNKIETSRLFVCSRCRSQVRICGTCDFGQLYCSQDCSQLARQETFRRASAAYQGTRRGKRLHAYRQQRLRDRKRREGKFSEQIVTQQYDNLKSAVLERVGDAIRFHPTFLELSRHYHFEGRPVAKGRGNEKGRVERKIRDVRDSFFAARTFTDLDDLNAQALTWCTDVVGQRRCPEDRSLSVREAFEEERPRLLALPDEPFPCHERVSVEVGKTPYVRFDLNDYSIPFKHVRRSLVVIADQNTVRVLDGAAVIAEHPRSWDRGRQIEDPAHIEALVAQKARAREGRGLDRLTRAAPSARELFRIAAERGANLGNLTSRLLALLDQASPAELDSAIVEAIVHDTPHAGAIQQILDKQRGERGLPPKVAPRWPTDSRAATVVVRPHALSSYDHLHKDPSRDD